MKGTADMIPGVAQLAQNDDGTFDWAGETDVFWDGQTTEKDEEDDSRWLLECPNGHQWFSEVEDD